MKPELVGYKWKKGVFHSEWNEFVKPLENEKTWTYGQLPEYIWLGLILEKLGRRIGINQAIKILKYLQELNPNIKDCKFSTLLSQSNDIQKNIYRRIQLLVGKDVLEPLTLVFDIHDYPIFNNYFYKGKSVEKRLADLENIMDKSMGSQTNFTTDIKYMVLFFMFNGDKIKLISNLGHIIDELNDYVNLLHEDEKMKMIRPTIRSLFVIVQSQGESNVDFLDKFWEDLSSMSNCKLFSANFVSKEMDDSLYKDNCIIAYRSIFEYFISIKKEAFVLDERMTVLLGLATFAYNKFYEVYKYKLFNTISGRSTVRGILEVIITMKYLICEEVNHDNIWKDYQLYGLGRYKLICEANKDKTDETKVDGKHICLAYLNMLVEEFSRSEFLDINMNYFDRTKIREKAELTGLSDLYSTYYEYLTSYEHGFWGSVRESSFIKCDNPAHQYHCVPCIELDDNLTSVWIDCVNLMQYIIDILNDEYGIPEKLLFEVRNFDKRAIVSKTQ